MDASSNQPWDFGQAVAEFSSGVVKGVKNFFGLVTKPFDNCGLGHASDSADDEQAKDDCVVLSTVGTRCPVGRGCLENDEGGVRNRRLTEETLGSLPPGGTFAGRGSRSASSSSNTLGMSNDSSGSVSSDDGGESYDGVIVQGTKPTVTFDHGVDVRIEWRDYLAETSHATDTGRDRAATMVDGDDFLSFIEAAASARTSIEQPQRVLSRAARFALMDDDDDNNKDGLQPLTYGRMKDIVSSGRGGTAGDGTESSGGGEGDDGEEEDDGGCTSLFESYDGSLASMKRLVFPPAIIISSRRNSRLPKKLFDCSALASRSPTTWMSPAELDHILSRTKGWKEGTGGRNNGRSGGRRARKKKPYWFDYRFDAKPDSRPSVNDELSRISVDNTVLKEELFGLALAEHRTSLLFKRAFLNW